MTATLGDHVTIPRSINMGRRFSGNAYKHPDRWEIFICVDGRDVKLVYAGDEVRGVLLDKHGVVQSEIILYVKEV